MLCGWEGNRRPGGMAAYRRVDDLTVTCGLTASTPGSALDPTLGIKYGKAFIFFYVLAKSGFLEVFCNLPMLDLKHEDHVHIGFALMNSRCC